MVAPPAPAKAPEAASVLQSPSKSAEVKADKKRKAAVQEVSPAKTKKSKTVSEASGTEPVPGLLGTILRRTLEPEASSKTVSQKVKHSKTLSCFLKGHLLRK